MYLTKFSKSYVFRAIGVRPSVRPDSFRPLSPPATAVETLCASFFFCPPDRRITLMDTTCTSFSSACSLPDFFFFLSDCAGLCGSWGRSCNGQGGFGDVETYGDDPDEMGDNLPFVDLGTGRTAVSLSAGDAHTCALLDDGSVKCWGKGYFGQTGLGRWHSTGQTGGQMGDSLPSLDLGTSPAAAAAPGRRALRGLQAAATAAAASVAGLSAGGQRSCAILDGGSVKCWGNAFAGALGLGDDTDRGGREGQMGDSLPMLSLGTGKVAVTPAPTFAMTPAPTPAPTVPVAATPTPTSLADVVVPVRGAIFRTLLLLSSVFCGTRNIMMLCRSWRLVLSRLFARLAARCCKLFPQAGGIEARLVVGSLSIVTGWVVASLSALLMF